MNKCVAIIGATILFTGVAAAADVPKAGAYLGYQWVRASDTGSDPSFTANGGTGQFIVNFNSWLSGVAEVGAIHNNAIGFFRLDTTMINFVGGPRFNLRRWKRVTPYGEVLVGGVYATMSNSFTGQPIQTFLLPGGPVTVVGPPVTGRFRQNTTNFALLAGGGVDIRLNKHVFFRPIGVDYYMTRIKNLRNGGDNDQNSIRYTAGFSFMFGGEKKAPPPPPPAAPRTKTCPDGSVVAMDAVCPKLNISLNVNATARELCPGDTTQVTTSVSGAQPNQLAFTWTVNGQTVGQGSTFEFNATGRAPGTYRVGVTAVGNNFNPATAETSITVLEYQPPTGTVSADPSSIRAGDKSTLSANFRGQCGGPIQAPIYEASEGSIVGDQFDSSSLRWDPNVPGEQRKTITITAKASDNKSVGTATTTIEVTKPGAVAPIRLPDVLFSQNSARVNNCGKRILLEQLRSYYERDSTGTVYLVGHTSNDEKSPKLAEQRAMNAAAVITAGTGVCSSIPQSQVQISSPGKDQQGVPFESGFCRSSVGAGASSAVEMRRVVVWFVPTGGQPPASVTNSQAATALPVSSLGCPK